MHKEQSVSEQKRSTGGAWLKSHLKIVVPVVIGLLALIILLSLIPTFILASVNGTYYFSFAGEFVEEESFTLKTGKWTHGGQAGTYRVKGKTVTLIYRDEILEQWFGRNSGLAERTTVGVVKNKVFNIKDGEDNVLHYCRKDHRHKYGKWITVEKPTCTEEGMESRACACGITEEQSIAATGHLLGKRMAEKLPTCTEEGYIEHWSCDGCGKNFTDETFEHELTEISIAALGHELKHFDYVAATCTEEGYIEHWSCDACGKNFSAEVGEDELIDISVPAVGHALYSADQKNYQCAICGSAVAHTEGLKYKLNDDEEAYCVIGIGDATDEEIVIPYTYEGKPVTGIGERAFYGCSKLKRATIPDSVKSIGDSAFYKCSGLTRICYAGDLAGWCNLSGINNLASSSRTIFVNGKELTGEIVIPDGVTSIGISTFYGCNGLTGVTISDCVTSVEYSAFKNCSGLKNVVFGNGVVSIEQSAFENCSGLTSVVIGNSVTNIEHHAFYDCKKLSSVYYMGTKAEWNQISIGSSNSALTSATRYYYVEKAADVPDDGGHYWHYVDGVPTAW